MTSRERTGLMKAMGWLVVYCAVLAANGIVGYLVRWDTPWGVLAVIAPLNAMAWWLFFVRWKLMQRALTCVGG